MASLSAMIEKDRKAPGRALSGDELDLMLMGRHGASAPSSSTPGVPGAPPGASTRRGGKKKPKVGAAAQQGLGNFVEEMNASFSKGTNIPADQMTVDSRQISQPAEKRGGRRPQKKD